MTGQSKFWSSHGQAKHAYFARFTWPLASLACGFLPVRNRLRGDDDIAARPGRKTWSKHVAEDAYNKYMTGTGRPIFLLTGIMKHS
jgi:hypothetical protein